MPSPAHTETSSPTVPGAGAALLAARTARVAALLAWGWWAGFLWLAPLLALLLELSARVEWRWEFSDREFDRLTDITTLAIAASVLYAITTRGSHGLLLVVTWMPMLLFPLVAAQRFSLHGGVQLGSLFLSLRRRRQLGEPLALRRVELATPYLATALVAAGVATDSDPLYFPVVTGIAAIALFPSRSNRYPLALWLLSIALVAGGGFLLQQGMRNAQLALEEWVVYWLEGWISDHSDPSHLTTAIGHIGRLKLSDRILWQVEVKGERPPPTLLPRATYQRYRFGNWSAPGQPTEPLQRLADGSGWQLGPAGDLPPERPATLRLSGDLKGGEGLLPLPPGAHTLHQLLAESVSRNRLGSLLTEGSPPFIRYRVQYDPLHPRYAPPEAADREVPKPLAETLEGLVTELGLQQRPPAEALQAIEAHFESHFRYSLFRREMRYDVPPLTDFLLRSKQGHCEYFAAATVLLLRAAGIPARYVSGYALMEYSDLADRYLVRKRHAHAWAIAHIGGRWQEADFTPATWADEEAQQHASWWGGLVDLWSLLDHAIQRSAMQEEEAGSYTLHILALLLLTALLAHRLYHRPRRFRQGGDRDTDRPLTFDDDSPLTRLLEQLAQRGLGPLPGETARQWLQRLTASGTLPIDPPQLRQGLALHYRRRFHPQGLEAADEEALQRLVAEWRAALGR